MFQDKNNITNRLSIFKGQSFLLLSDKIDLEQLIKIQKNIKDNGGKVTTLSFDKIEKELKHKVLLISPDQDVQSLKNLLAQSAEILDFHYVEKCLQAGKMVSRKQFNKHSSTTVEKVRGVGPGKAGKLKMSHGVENIQMLNSVLEKKPDILTQNQKNDLKYYEELKIPISRDIVTVILNFLEEVLNDITKDNQNKIVACGQYRREQETCENISILITRKDGQYMEKLFSSFIDELSTKKFLISHRVSPKWKDNQHCQTYQGICQHEGRKHRINMRYYPQDQYPFALLSLTGNQVFNRFLRIKAKSRGYHLSDNSLKNAKGEKIPCKTEEEVFSMLGKSYIPPRARRF